MVWTPPRTWVDGETEDAARLNMHIRDNLLALFAGGGLVFTTEAARDALITAPTEGMSVYLSAPTVPAQTGDNNPTLPTGITTVYDGTVWVCTTPVAGGTLAGGTVTSTSMTATLAGSPGTNPSVTLVTGTTALVSVTARIATTAGDGGYVGVAVSGATTKASTANNAWLAYGTAAVINQGSYVFEISGLTAGTNTFTVQYQSVAGAVATMTQRYITVQGIA